MSEVSPILKELSNINLKEDFIQIASKNAKTLTFEGLSNLINEMNIRTDCIKEPNYTLYLNLLKLELRKRKK